MEKKQNVNENITTKSKYREEKTIFAKSTPYKCNTKQTRTQGGIKTILTLFEKGYRNFCMNRREKNTTNLVFFEKNFLSFFFYKKWIFFQRPYFKYMFNKSKMRKEKQSSYKNPNSGNFFPPKVQLFAT